MLLEQLNDLVDVKPLKQTWHVVSLVYSLTVIISLSDTDICIIRLQGHSIMEGHGKNKVEWKGNSSEHGDFRKSM